MSKLRIGTCSWKYDSWRGLIYPVEGKFDYLKEYSKHYSTVEIDQWFWSLHNGGKITLPKETVVEEYVKSVPKNFKFSIKVPNSITLTHFYRKSKSEPLIPNENFLSNKLFNSFLKSLKPMWNNLGPLMFQFEYLNKEKMSCKEEFQNKFESFISKCSRDFDYAIEIRNPNYLDKNYFQFLRENKITHVFLQGYYMPSIVDIYKKFENEFRNQVVIRLHGPDRKGIEEKSEGSWNKIIEAKDSELNDIVSMIQTLQSHKVNVYLNVNNHYEGSAPLTIQKITQLLKD
ncbi:MAG: DUF72 domain-containing protein [Ignavibacteria bacterium]|nr:DUF72 domain-containing protein [Ignavibacteria bacterium]